MSGKSFFSATTITHQSLISSPSRVEGLPSPHLCTPSCFWSDDVRGSASTCRPRPPSLHPWGESEPFGEGPGKEMGGDDELDGTPGRVLPSIRANTREQSETERLNGV